MILDGLAFYVEGSDIIVADVYLFDKATNKYTTNRIKEASAKLMAGSKVHYTLSFDKRMGTSSGAIRLTVSHPTQSNGLSFSIVVVLDTNEKLQKTIPVGKRPKSAFEGENPFSEQPFNTDSIRDTSRIMT